LGLFSQRLEKYIKASTKEIKELNLYDKLSESDKDIVEIIFNFNIGILPTQYHWDYEDGRTHINREHILDIERAKQWLYEKEQKEINKGNSSSQLDHVFGTGSNRKYYNKDQWAKKQKSEQTQTYKFELGGFKTWEDWQRIAKEKKLKELRESKRAKESQNNKNNKTEIEPSSLNNNSV
jgi:hypothetical protein